MPAVRPHGAHTARKQGAQVLLRGLSGPHARIHGGGQQNGRLRGQQRGGEHVIRNAAGQLGHQVGRSRSHKHHIGLLRQGYMPDVPGFGSCKGIHTHRAGAEGFKGKRRDQLCGVLCHDDVHLCAQLLQPGHDLACLIGRDAARHAHDHMSAAQHISPPDRGRADR